MSKSASVRTREGEDRVADELARAVPGYVAAAVRMKEVDSEPLPFRFVNTDIAQVTAPPDSVDRIVLEKEKLVLHTVRLPLLHQPLLQFEAVGVSDPPEFPHMDRATETDQVRTSSGKFSILFFRSEMNWSATAPSIILWSYDMHM